MSTREGKGDNGGAEIFWNGLNACSEKCHGVLALFFVMERITFRAVLSFG